MNDIEVDDSDLGLLRVNEQAIKTRLAEKDWKQKRLQRYSDYLEEHYDELYDELEIILEKLALPAKKDLNTRPNLSSRKKKKMIKKMMIILVG